MRFTAFMCMTGRQNIKDACSAVVSDNGGKRLCFHEKPVCETMCELINERVRDDRLHEHFHAIVTGNAVQNLTIFAHSDTNGIRLQYRIETDRVLNPAGDEHFRTGTTITEMLVLLCNREEYEAVCSYFRNSVMAVAETNPGGQVHTCNERSGKTEGFVAVTKSTTTFDARPYRHGRKWFECSCHFTSLGKIFAALVRPQHGIKSHLGPLTCIT